LDDASLFDLERTNDGRWSHSLYYADEVAYALEDLVSESVSMLRDIRGVEEVVHEDRDVLLLRAPAAADEEIRAALTSFWTQASRRRAPWKVPLERATDALAPILKESGFQRRDRVWNRNAEDGIVHVLKLGHDFDEQSRKHRAFLKGGLFLVNATFFGDAPPWVGIDRCMTPRAGYGRSIVHCFLPLESLPAAAVGWVKDRALNFFDERSTLQGLNPREFDLLDGAKVAFLKGEPVLARELLEIAHASERSFSKKTVEDVVALMRLPEIEPAGYLKARRLARRHRRMSEGALDFSLRSTKS